MQVHPKQASQYTIDGVLVIPSEEKESWLQGQAPAGVAVLAGDGLPHRGISEQSSEGKKAGAPHSLGRSGPGWQTVRVQVPREEQAWGVAETPRRPMWLE